jgi:hypothetical protein
MEINASSTANRLARRGFSEVEKGISYFLSALFEVVPGIPILSGAAVPGFFHHQNLQNIPHNGNQPAEIMQKIQQKILHYLSLSRRC